MKKFLKLSIAVLALLFAFGCEEDNPVEPEPNRYSIPYPPKNLTASFVHSTRIYLTWHDMSDNEDGFEISEYNDYYKDTCRVPENLTVINTDEWNHGEMRYSNGFNYKFKVRAFNRGGESPWSNEVNLRVP